MKKFGYKGFSLVELLVAIVILGMLMSVAVISATRWLDKAKKDYYESLNKNLILVGQSYVQDNHNSLPKAIGRSTKISLQTLKDKKYLTSDVLDYSKKACDLEKSYVRVFKYSQNDYSYMSYLVCPNYTSKEETYANGPEIEIDFDNAVNVARAKVTMTDPDKIISYSYIVYKDGVEVKNTGNVSAKLKEEVKTTISLKKYVPSKIKITVVATDIYGNVSRKSETKELKDTIAPICGTITGASTTWATGERKITVACTDDGVGCERASYSKTFKNSMKEGTITIKDKSGNSTNCKVNVYLDNDTPTTPTSQVRYNGSTGALKTDTNWTNQNLWWGNFSSNSVSGIDHYEYSEDCKNKTGNVANGTLYQTDMNKSYCLRAVNKVGAVSPWSSASTFRIDKTAPSVPSSQIRVNNASGTLRGSVNAWTNQTLWWGNFSSTDSSSGIASYQYSTNCTGSVNGTLSPSYTYGSSVNYTFCIRAVDKAGNTSAWSGANYFKIDKDPPKCSSGGGSTAWTNVGRTLTGSCSDTGGSGCKGNASWLINWEGNWTNLSPGTVCDNAGNCTTCPANQTVRVDKTAPSCTWGSSTNNVLGNQVTNNVINENGSYQSGLSKYTINNTAYSASGAKKTFNYTTATSCSNTTYTMTVQDVAGNSSSCSKTFNASNLKNNSGVYFYYLNSAFSGTNSGGTIYTQCSYIDSPKATVAGSKTLTLNIGHTLTKNNTAASNDDYTTPGIQVNGGSTLTVTGGGTWTTTQRRRLVVSNGVLNVNMSGTILKNVGSGAGGACLKTDGSGTINFQNGTLKCDREGISHTDPSTRTQTIRVSGGSVLTKARQAIICGYGDVKRVNLTITGGTFCSGNSDAIYLSPDCHGSIKNAKLRYVASDQDGLSSRPSTVKRSGNSNKQVSSCW